MPNFATVWDKIHETPWLGGTWPVTWILDKLQGIGLAWGEAQPTEHGTWRMMAALCPSLEEKDKEVSMSQPTTAGQLRE